ncbi:hypothetical protein L7F22_015399, partial [Adiantum nelumboides]|nr:hypothetical protein [Adiantum nelumboides]
MARGQGHVGRALCVLVSRNLCVQRLLYNRQQRVVAPNATAPTEVQGHKRTIEAAKAKAALQKRTGMQ